MRFVISLMIGLLLFASAGMALTVLDRVQDLGYWPAVLLLGVSALGAGYVIGYNGRDAFGGLIAGFSAVAYLWFVDTSSAWASEVLKAPLTNLNTDEVLLGLSLTLFAFLSGARLGETAGLAQLRKELLATAAVSIQRGTPPGGTFALPAPPEVPHSDVTDDDRQLP